jgi:hypothetical protein
MMKAGVQEFRRKKKKKKKEISPLPPCSPIPYSLFPLLTDNFLLHTLLNI